MSPGEAAPSNAAPESSQSTSTTTPQTPEVAAARNDFDNAERQLATAQGDCATACRALASMERAAEHICGMATNNECERARERVQAARDRIRSTCGSCG